MLFSNMINFYHPSLRVDSEGAIAESNEGNNEAASVLYIEADGSGGQPDLVIRDMVFTPSSVATGEEFAVMFRVQNDGDAAAPPCIAHWGIATIGGACDCPVPEVGAGGSYRCTCSPMTAPPNPGNYGTWATADFEGVVAESDEGNNETSLTLTVTE